MRTKLDPDDEFFIPDVSGFDWSKAESAGTRRPGETTEICIDGAIEYSLRLIPSNKILGPVRVDARCLAGDHRDHRGRPISPNTVAGLGWRTDGAGASRQGPRLERWARRTTASPAPTLWLPREPPAARRGGRSRHQ